MADAEDRITQRSRSSAGKAATIYVCAAIGGFIAALADMVQKEDASAVEKLTSTTARHLHVTMEPYWILGILVAMATALCFVFQPNERKQSFLVGLGIIPAVMTVTPYKAPLTGTPKAMLPLSSSPNDGALWRGDARVIRANMAPVIPFGTVLVRNQTGEVHLISVNLFDPTRAQEFAQRQLVSPYSDFMFRFEPTLLSPMTQVQLSIDNQRMDILRFADFSTGSITLALSGRDAVVLNGTQQLQIYQMTVIPGGAQGFNVLRRLGGKIGW
jgi:hypothetical protein